jgi:hypothetical protein
METMRDETPKRINPERWRAVVAREIRLPPREQDWEGQAMRNVLAMACAALMLGAIVCGQKPQAATSPAAKPTAEEKLTNLLDLKIKAEWQAIKDKDKTALGDLLTEDYVEVEADAQGERYKWKALSELERSSVTDFTLSFLKVTPLCADAAFARYEVFIKFPPNSAVKFEKILVGEIWVKREGQWKALHYQETRVK